MSRKRFFLPSDISLDSVYELTEKERHYLARVLRLKVGDKVELFDGYGREGVGVLEGMDARHLRVRVVEVGRKEERRFDLILCQSLPKKGKMDLIVEKATELGVSKIIPLVTHRSVSRPRRGEEEKKVARWQRIAQEAARQSGRAIVPEVLPIVEFESFLMQGFPPGFLPLLLWEGGESKGREVAEWEKVNSYRGVMVVVGPEGGFDDKEVQKAKERGFIPLWMGPYVLRTETAAIVICALIQHARGAFPPMEGHKGD